MFPLFLLFFCDSREYVAKCHISVSYTHLDVYKRQEKLSSGYKINRAADDAAGLSISEKMRKQIRGLDKASSNAQDLSLIHI